MTRTAHETEEDDRYGGPVLVQPRDPEPGTLYSTTLAEAIAEPGFPAKTARVFTRNCARSGLIHPYGRSRTDARGSYLYRADQAVVLGVLRRMMEAGLTDGASARAMSNALGIWRQEDMPPSHLPMPHSPAHSALVAYLHGVRGFWAELHVFRDPDTAKLQHVARIRNDSGQGTNFTVWNPEMALRSVWTTSLDSVLAHLTRAKGSVH